MASLLELLSLYVAAALAPVTDRVDIVFAGDAMQHAAQIEAARRDNASYDYTECFEAVSDYITRADYAVVNLEAPLGGAPYAGYPCFSAPDTFAAALQNAGFDLFLTANNHTLDRRDRGLVRTITVLDSLGVDHIGTYKNDSCRAASLPLVKDIGGFKVGFLNYTYGTNGFTPGPNVVVDYIDTLQIKRDVALTRSADAEIIVAAIHWGDEYQLLPNKTQRRLADILTGMGVDVVMGGHPHVIQPMELRINPQDSLDRKLVVYSLGNFISNMKTRDTRGGVMLRLHLQRTLSGKAYVAGASYQPVFTVPAERGHNFKLIDATDTVQARQWNYHRRQFLEAAEGIFRRHNVAVGRDTLFNVNSRR